MKCDSPFEIILRALVALGHGLNVLCESLRELEQLVASVARLERTTSAVVEQMGSFLGLDDLLTTVLAIHQGRAGILDMEQVHGRVLEVGSSLTTVLARLHNRELAFLVWLHHQASANLIVLILGHREAGAHVLECLLRNELVRIVDLVDINQLLGLHEDIVLHLALETLQSLGQLVPVDAVESDEQVVTGHSHRVVAVFQVLESVV